MFKNKKRIKELEEQLEIQMSNNKFLNNMKKELNKDIKKLQTEVKELKRKLKQGD